MFQLSAGRLRMTVVAIGIIVAVGAIMLYLFVSPESGLYPRCAFKMLTGLSCPGCGSQRALHAMLGGDFISALRFNALFVLEIPLLALLACAYLLRRRMPALNRMLSERVFILSILTIIILWTVVRNIIDI